MSLTKHNITTCDTGRRAVSFETDKGDCPVCISRSVCADREKVNQNFDAKLRELRGKLEAAGKHIEILSKQVGLVWHESANEKPENSRHVAVKIGSTYGVWNPGTFGVVDWTQFKKWAYFNPPETQPDEEKAWEANHWTPNLPNGITVTEEARRIFLSGYRAAKEGK